MGTPLLLMSSKICTKKRPWCWYLPMPALRYAPGGDVPNIWHCPLCAPRCYSVEAVRPPPLLSRPTVRLCLGRSLKFVRITNTTQSQPSQEDPPRLPRSTLSLVPTRYIIECIRYCQIFGLILPLKQWWPHLLPWSRVVWGEWGEGEGVFRDGG